MVDKYEYKLRFEQMKALTDEGDYEAAAEIADTIQWRKVKNVNLLIKAGDIFFKLKRYEDAKEILQMAYDRTPIGRMIIYRLAEIAVKTKDFEEAKAYYDEFVEIAPHDNLKYVLRYKISKAKGADILTRIAILEELKDAEFTEEWAFELAYLYHKAGEFDKCIDACDEIILWFGDGIYVERALELKLLHRPLTQTQEEKYRACRRYRDGVKEVYPQEEVVQIPAAEEVVGKLDTPGHWEEQPVVPEQEESVYDEPQTVQDTEDIKPRIVQGTQDNNTQTVHDTEDIMDLLADVIPRADTDIKPPQPMQEGYPLQESQPVQEEYPLPDDQLVPRRGRLHMDNRIRRPQTYQEEDTIESDLLSKIKRAKPRFQAQTDEHRYIPGRIRQPGISGQFEEEQPIDYGGYTGPLQEEMPESYEGKEEQLSYETPESYGGEEEQLAYGTPERYESKEEQLPYEMPESYEGEIEQLSYETPESYEDEQFRDRMPESYGAFADQPVAKMNPDYGVQNNPFIHNSSKRTVHSTVIDTESYEEYEAEQDIRISEKESGAFQEPAFQSDFEDSIEQEEMRRAEAEFYGIQTEVSPNQPMEDPNHGSLVEEMLARQDTKEIKAKQIEEALDKHAMEMLIEEEATKIEGDIVAEPEILQEITELDEEMRSIFSYFVPVAGMEAQICRTLTNTLGKFTGQIASAERNILIQGSRGCGKTIFAKRLVKALKKESQRKDITVGSIDAEKLNQKDLAKLLEKVSGGCLVIERAGEISRETAIKLSLLLENDDTGILVILEDTRVGLEEALKQDDAFAKKFTQRIIIPVFTNDELVEFGKAYAHERDYEIDAMGVLALYNRINNIQKLDRPTTLIEIKDIIDEAIEKAEKKSWKKAFSFITSRRYTENDYIILREKDIEE